MKIIPSIVTLLFLIAAGTVSSPAQNATTVEPLLVYKALQDKDCRHWVDSVMDKLSFKEKVGQLFIHTIAPVDTKRNLELLREVIDTYKVGGLLFSGGKMQNQVELTNRAQRQAKVPLMITFDGEDVYENEAVKSNVLLISDDPYYFFHATIQDMKAFILSVRLKSMTQGTKGS